MGEHAGRAYAIVGGTSGMGHAAAIEIANSGGRIALIGRSTKSANVAATVLAGAAKAEIIGIGIDGAQLGLAVEQAADRLGGLDGLAVTAGPIHVQGSFLDLTDADWAESFDTQLMTVVRACRAALPIFKTRGGGRIVTMAAYSTRSQKSFLPHYAAMKSAIVSLTKNIAKFHGADNICANCIAPGAIATEALDQAADEAVTLYGGPRDAALNRFMIEKWGMKVALGRVGKPAEVGELIAFLLSPRAAYMTGALINIDGGTDF